MAGKETGYDKQPWRARQRDRNFATYQPRRARHSFKFGLSICPFPTRITVLDPDPFALGQRKGPVARARVNKDTRLFAPRQAVAAQVVKAELEGAGARGLEQGSDLNGKRGATARFSRPDAAQLRFLHNVLLALVDLREAEQAFSLRVP